jgi:serine/threonine protein kinase
MEHPSENARICHRCHRRTSQQRCPTCGIETIGLDKDPDGLIGATVGGQYRIASRLGRGGMGMVYRAIQLSVDRPVAVKVISQRFASDTKVIKRFQREAKLTSKLQHPNSIRLYDFGLTETGLPYLVMELLEGHELAREIKNVGQMPLPRAVNLATQVLKALHEAHGHGIVHRDLKPANIFLHRVAGEGDMVKVMDFGIAKMFRAEGDHAATLTAAGFIVGTPQYMSPEQCSAERVDHRSDLYSCGIILYQMLAGRPPFIGETPMAILVKQTQEMPPLIGAFRPDLVGNAALGEAFERLLAKRADERPASALHAIKLLQLAAPGAGETSLQPLEGLDTDAFRRMELARRTQIETHKTVSLSPQDMPALAADDAHTLAEAPRDHPAGVDSEGSTLSLKPGRTSQPPAASSTQVARTGTNRLEDAPMAWEGDAAFQAPNDPQDAATPLEIQSPATGSVSSVGIPSAELPWADAKSMESLPAQVYAREDAATILVNRPPEDTLVPHEMAGKGPTKHPEEPLPTGAENATKKDASGLPQSAEMAAAIRPMGPRRLLGMALVLAFMAVVWKLGPETLDPGADTGGAESAQVPPGEGQQTQKAGAVKGSASATAQEHPHSVTAGGLSPSEAAEQEAMPRAAGGTKDADLVKTAAKPMAQAQVRLVVKTVPSGAAVWLDGRKVGTSPLDEVTVPLGKEVRLEARKPGYQTGVLVVRAERDSTVEVSLEVEKKEQAVPSGAKARLDRQNKPAPSRKTSDADLLEDL